MQVINTNLMSLNAQRNLSSTGSELATSLERLSSGLRINSAKDDAAGLAISERFTTQIRGMNQAARNANDGISLAQTAEGAMVEISNNLQRIRELAVQSRNATNSATDRAALDAEAQELKDEIDRVASQTAFNGVNLLDGSFTSKEFQIGANAGETISIDSIANAQSSALGSYSEARQVSSTFSATGAIADGEFTLTVDGTTTSIGTVAAGSTVAEQAGNVRDAINSVSEDTGVYAISETSTSITLVGSEDFDITIGGTLDATTTGFANGATSVTASTQTGFSTLDISTVGGADTAINAMDAALSAVNSSRAELGAMQNRFESVVASLETSSENLSAARSRIQDTDFAAETASLTRAKILQQAGTAMLAQANAAPQNVLSLLQ